MKWGNERVREERSEGVIVGEEGREGVIVSEGGSDCE